MSKAQKGSACGLQFGQGLGGVRRICCREAEHDGRCTDMPFLMHLEKHKPKVADKIVRDSFNTRVLRGARRLTALRNAGIDSPAGR